MSLAVLDLNSAQEHIGEMVLEDAMDRRGSRQIPCRLIGIRKGKALIQAPGHRRPTTVEFAKLQLWKKGNAQQADHQAAHEGVLRRKTVAEPTDLDRRVVHIKGTRLFVARGGFVASPDDASSYLRDEDARRCITRLVKFGHHEAIKGATDLSIVGLTKARMMLNDWRIEDATKQADEMREPEVLGGIEVAEPTNVSADPIQFPTAEVVEDRHEEDMPGFKPDLPAGYVTSVSDNPLDGNRTVGGEEDQTLAQWIQARRDLADAEGLMHDAAKTEGQWRARLDIARARRLSGG